MRRYTWLVVGVAALFLVALAVPSTTDAGRLFRLSAEWSPIDTEVSDDTGVLVPFYSKTVTVPVIGDDTGTILYITMFGQGDVHSSENLLVECTVDTVACSNNTTFKALLGDPAVGTFGDWHDVNIVATWCAPANSGSHTVELTFRSSAAIPDFVFIENLSVYIDAARTAQGPCFSPGGFIGF